MEREGEGGGDMGLPESHEENEGTQRSRLCRDVIVPIGMYGAGGGHGTSCGTALQAGEWDGGWRCMIER